MLCILLMVLNSVKAQTFTYTYDYDLSGNRTLRTCIQAKSGMGESIFDSEKQTLKESYEISEVLDDYVGETQITVFPNPTRGELQLPFV